MVEVSDKWKEKFNETLVPESFVEITCGITEPGINKKLPSSRHRQPRSPPFTVLRFPITLLFRGIPQESLISLFLTEVAPLFLLPLRMELLVF